MLQLLGKKQDHTGYGAGCGDLRRSPVGDVEAMESVQGMAGLHDDVLDAKIFRIFSQAPPPAIIIHDLKAMRRRQLRQCLQPCTDLSKD